MKAMKSTKIILSWFVVSCLLVSCINKPSVKQSESQCIAEDKAPSHTDRSFFFLKGKVKEMSLSYRYDTSLQSQDGPYKNAEGIKVNFDERGLIERLRWKNFDYTFDNPEREGTFSGKGDPKLADRYYYVVDSGMRTTYPYQHTIQIQLKQMYNGDVVGGEVAACDASFDNSQRLKKLGFNLFSSLIYAIGGNYTSEEFEYRKETDDFPALVQQEITSGGDGYINTYEIKYRDMDEQGNWLKAKYYEDGSLKLVVTRVLAYY